MRKDDSLTLQARMGYCVRCKTNSRIIAETKSGSGLCLTCCRYEYGDKDRLMFHFRLGEIRT
jgi:hypothetical protein